MKNKKFLLWTSVLTLLPILVGLVLWNRLPAEMPTHWSLSGGPNGWSGKGFTVFGLPAVMLALHWLLVGATYLDRRNVGHNEKLMKVILLIFPVLSNMMMTLLYNIVLGLELNITRVMMPLLGLMFIAMGNYLPKCKQNGTLGIKLKWTLYNEENWNKTHRFGGKVFMLVGLGFVLVGFASQTWMMILMVGLIVLAVAAPTVYSWRLYKKQLVKGTWVQSESSKAAEKKLRRVKWISLIAVVLILTLTAVLMFSGKIDVVYASDSFTIEASYWSDLTVSYAEIDSVEYRAEGVEGTREWGWGSARLLLGLFRSEEFGNYTRYTYTGGGACVVIRSTDGDVLVLNGRNDAATQAIYDKLNERTAP